MSGLTWKNEGGELWEAWFWDLWHPFNEIDSVAYDLWIAFPDEPLVDDLYEAAARVTDLVHAHLRRIEAMLDAAEDGA